MTVAFFWRVVGILLFLALLVGAQFVPEWQVNRASVRSAVVNPEPGTTPADVAALQNEMRKTYLQTVGGIIAIIALILTYRRVVVAEQGHITDRYTKAIEQLGALTGEGKPNVEVRLGAIYALERIAIDSFRDHWTIMEVLAAYVRQNAPKPMQEPTKKENEKAIEKGPATEIQAILTVLCRRRGRGRENKEQALDLRGSDLRGANFIGSHVEKADFFGANLEGAGFELANLQGARFLDARLGGARFLRAVGLSVDQFIYMLPSEPRDPYDCTLFRAEGWENAKFDEPFIRELKLMWAKIPQDAIPQPETRESRSHPGEEKTDGRGEVSGPSKDRL